MVQNLLFSGVIIAALIPTAALGLLGLGAVVASDELAEIVVILNGLRARRMATDSSYSTCRTIYATTSEVVHA